MTIRGGMKLNSMDEVREALKGMIDMMHILNDLTAAPKTISIAATHGMLDNAELKSGIYSQALGEYTYLACSVRDYLRGILIEKKIALVDDGGVVPIVMDAHIPVMKEIFNELNRDWLFDPQFGLMFDPMAVRPVDPQEEDETVRRVFFGTQVKQGRFSRGKQIPPERPYIGMHLKLLEHTEIRSALWYLRFPLDSYTFLNPDMDWFGEVMLLENLYRIAFQVPKVLIDGKY